MKKSIIILSLGFIIGLINNQPTGAQQLAVNVHINLDRQPAWGPSGYSYASFYYLPEIDIYFDVESSLFYYLNGRRWVSSYYLPERYHRYDFYGLYKVVLNDYQRPWRYNESHRKMYAKYYHNRTQTPIFHMKSHAYHKAKGNTRAWVEPQRGMRYNNYAKKQSSHSVQKNNKAQHNRTDKRNLSTNRSNKIDNKNLANKPQGKQQKKEIVSNNKKEDKKTSRYYAAETKNNKRSGRNESNRR